MEYTQFALKSKRLDFFFLYTRKSLHKRSLLTKCNYRKYRKTVIVTQVAKVYIYRATVH